MEFRVRAAAAGDAESIARLSSELGYPLEAPTMRARLESVIGRADQRVLVAELPGGTVCGWIQAHSSVTIGSGPRVEIAGLIVSGDVRREGVGRALVGHAEAWASEIGAEAVVVRTNTKRAESHAFYPSLGYAVSKTQAVYTKRAGT